MVLTHGRLLAVRILIPKITVLTPTDRTHITHTYYHGHYLYSKSKKHYKIVLKTEKRIKTMPISSIKSLPIKYSASKAPSLNKTALVKTSSSEGDVKNKLKKIKPKK
jgi:hypothetical protein